MLSPESGLGYYLEALGDISQSRLNVTALWRNLQHRNELCSRTNGTGRKLLGIRKSCGRHICPSVQRKHFTSFFFLIRYGSIALNVVEHFQFSAT